MQAPTNRAGKALPGMGDIFIVKIMGDCRGYSNVGVMVRNVTLPE